MEAASRHVLVVGDEVWFSAPEPMWACYMREINETVPSTSSSSARTENALIRPIPAGPGTTITSWPAPDSGSTAFEQAKSWIRSTHGEVAVTVHGRIEAMNRAFVNQDDVGMVLRDRIPEILKYLSHCIHNLSAPGLAAWKKLSDASDSITRYDNGTIDADCPGLTAALRVLHRDCADGFFPPSDRYGTRTAASYIAKTLNRIDFELDLRSALAAEDTLALAAILP
jgi:hypothetical protein